jgi:hypothetical protein
VESHHGTSYLKLTGVPLVVAIVVTMGTATHSTTVIERLSKLGDSTLPLRVRNVRIKPAPDIESTSTVNVSFDLINAGSVSLTNIVLQVFILEAVIPTEPDREPTILAGPFSIRTKIVFEPAFTINYQLRLRNISSDCDCIADVKIVSFQRPLTHEPEYSPF